MIAAIYARKSNEQNDVTEEQKSVTRQIDGARAFIASRGWTLDDTQIGTKHVKGPDGTLVNRPIFRHIYEDDGVSGALPEGMDSAADLPKITQALLDRGYSADDIRKILGGNLLRVFREVERVSREMQAVR